MWGRTGQKLGQGVGVPRRGSCGETERKGRAKGRNRRGPCLGDLETVPKSRKAEWSRKIMFSMLHKIRKRARKITGGIKTYRKKECHNGPLQGTSQKGESRVYRGFGVSGVVRARTRTRVYKDKRERVGAGIS